MHKRTLAVFLACFFFVSVARADEISATHHPARRAAGITLASIGGTFLTAGAAFCIATMIASGNDKSEGGGLVVFADLVVGGAAALVGLATLVPGIVLIAKSRTEPAIVVRPRDESKSSSVIPSAHVAPLLSFHF
jgi:hypothetical protein